jgi:hypothetical protein
MFNGLLPARRQFETFRIDSSRRLNHHSNFLHIIAHAGTGALAGKSRARSPNRNRRTGVRQGEGQMAAYELVKIERAPRIKRSERRVTLVHAKPVEKTGHSKHPASGDPLFELGMDYAVGRSVPVDLVSAHKWFNLAAMKGNQDAVRLRREIAEQLSESEIAEAQRAARNWLTTH